MRHDLHSKSIDALRGIAAISVFFSHADTSHLATNSWLSDHKNFTGDFGVYVFFCLSGYLIWQAAIRCLDQEHGLTRYAIHRATRIAPLYFVNVIIVAFALKYIGSSWIPSDDTYTLLRHLLFTQDLYPSVARSINPVLWTITHEVTYYILVPPIIIFGTRNKFSILLFSVLIYVISMSADLVQTVRFATIFYAFALGIFIVDAKKNEFLLVFSLALTVAVFTYFTETRAHLYAGRITGATFAMAIIWITKGKTCGNFLSKVLAPSVFLGCISYSFYIWHYQIIYVVEKHYSLFNHNIPGWSEYSTISGSILLAICIAISYASYSMIEKPSMSTLRKRLESRIIPSTATA